MTLFSRMRPEFDFRSSPSRIVPVLWGGLLGVLLSMLTAHIVFSRSDAVLRLHQLEEYSDKLAHENFAYEMALKTAAERIAVLEECCKDQRQKSYANVTNN